MGILRYPQKKISTSLKINEKNNEKNNFYTFCFFAHAIKFVGTGKWVPFNKTKINKWPND